MQFFPGRIAEWLRLIPHNILVVYDFNDQRTYLESSRK